MVNPYRVIYCGMDVDSLFDLSSDSRLQLVGINYMPEFVSKKAGSPVDLFFKWSYRLRVAERFRILELVLLAICKPIPNLLSPLYRKYLPYAWHVAKLRLRVVDFSSPAKVASHVQRYGGDVVVVNNWWILQQEVVAIPRYGTVNIHPSRLPQYRGSLPTLWSLKNRDTSSAVSYILLGASIDGGDLIAQHSFAIEPQDTAITLEEKIRDIVYATLTQDLVGYLNGKLKPSSQQGPSSKTAKYYEYMEIRWKEENARDIRDKVWLYPYLWPLDHCYFIDKGRKIRVKNIVIVPNTGIITEEDEELIVSFSSYRVKAADAFLRMRLFKDIGWADSCRLIINHYHHG